jgi:hypothetical protein
MNPKVANLLQQQASWQQDRRQEPWADKLRKSARARAALPTNWPIRPPKKDKTKSFFRQD